MFPPPSGLLKFLGDQPGESRPSCKIKNTMGSCKTCRNGHLLYINISRLNFVILFYHTTRCVPVGHRTFT